MTCSFTNYVGRESISHLGISSLLSLNNFENKSVFCENSKDVDDTGHYPRLYGRQTLSLGGIGCDGVEDVDQDKEQGDQQRHAT